MKKILECVPNFSEGQNTETINAVCNEISKIKNVKLLHTDIGYTTNRTVITFAGEPDAVCEAAFMAMAKAAKLIDMSKHKGNHPRMGATDVCPLVPVYGVTMQEAVIMARKLAERVFKELGIPVYCYENAAFRPERQNLAYCRKGEYEGLKDRILSKKEKPDFSPDNFTDNVAKTGATAIGAREFLIAVNFSLNTKSVEIANEIAYDVREKGRNIIDNEGIRTQIHGSLKSVKAIGWYIEEYSAAQVSMNINDINVTPLHIAFEEVCKKAHQRGVGVIGTEIIGLLPQKVLLTAGSYYSKVENSDNELIKTAVEKMLLNGVKPFKPNEKILEVLLKNKS